MAGWLRELAIYYAQCVEVLRRLARTLTWQPHRVRQAGPVPQGWPYAIAGLRPGISEVAAGARTAAPAPETWVTHPLDLDIGEVADGYHLIARSVSLSAQDLMFEYAFSPELTREAHRKVWLNMFYDADISPPNWNYIGAEGDVQYARPPQGPGSAVTSATRCESVGCTPGTKRPGGCLMPG